MADTLDDLMAELADLPSASPSSGAARSSVQQRSAWQPQAGALPRSVSANDHPSAKAAAAASAAQQQPHIAAAGSGLMRGQPVASGPGTSSRASSTTSAASPALGTTAHHHHSQSMPAAASPSGRAAQGGQQPHAGRGATAQAQQQQSMPGLARENSFDALLQDLGSITASDAEQRHPSHRSSMPQQDPGQPWGGGGGGGSGRRGTLNDVSLASGSMGGGGPVSSFKCMGLFLGGAGARRGRNGADIGVVRCCDALRCTKCDFKVIAFQQQGWRAGAEYLFFRNNYPTEAKLAPMLEPQPRACAYCCQCSWRTATGSEGERVDSYASDLRWICGGHGG